MPLKRLRVPKVNLCLLHIAGSTPGASSTQGRGFLVGMLVTISVILEQIEGPPDGIIHGSPRSREALGVVHGSKSLKILEQAESRASATPTCERPS